MADSQKCGWSRHLHDGATYQEVCNRPATVQFVFNQGQPGEFVEYRCAEHAELFRQEHQGWNVPESPVGECELSNRTRREETIMARSKPLRIIGNGFETQKAANLFIKELLNSQPLTPERQRKDRRGGWAFHC